MSARRKITIKLALVATATFSLTQAAQADPINWRHSVEAAKLEASQSGKLVLLHFYTPSCGPCKKLERDVFSQPQIAAAMQQNFIPVKLNADNSPAIANAYQIKSVPFEVVLNSQGNVVQKLNCPLNPNAYGSQLLNVAKHYQAREAVQPASAQAPMNSAYAGLKIGQSSSQPSANKQAFAVQPQVTTNPYFSSPPPAQPKPATSSIAQQTQPTAAPPTTPMDRYQGRYAPAAAPAASTPANVAQTPPPAATSPQTSSTTVAAVAAKPPVLQEKSPQSAPEVWPPELPAGTPALAFEGYCPVSLRESKKWVRGKKEIGAIHRGRTYLFASEALRDKFLASTYASDSYSPVFSGSDPVKLLDDNQQVAGSRKFGFEYRNAFYLFSSKETMERFARQPDRYSAGVRQAMTRMDEAANGTVRR